MSVPEVSKKKKRRINELNEIDFIRFTYIKRLPKIITIDYSGIIDKRGSRGAARAAKLLRWRV